MEVKDNGDLPGGVGRGDGQERPDFVCSLKTGAMGLPDILDKKKDGREGGRGGGREREREYNNRDLTTISEVIGVSNWKSD